MIAPKDVLIIGGTRFSGLYLWKELYDRGHKVTIFNRGKTSLKPLRGESDEDFQTRKSAASYVNGDRKIAEDLAKLSNMKFDVIYDMNGRQVEDTAPLADMFNGKVEHFIYMSSAGVYKKSNKMPHIEGDEVDFESRHKGKLKTEEYLSKIGIPFTSVRPTYIYGPGNYNPLEEYFFVRLDAGRKLCIPGHGQHLMGLGHVEDLAVAMAQIIGRPQAVGKCYNVQDSQCITFQGMGTMCAKAMGMDPKKVDFMFYPKKEMNFGDLKSFPMREQHFFCSVANAMADLDWKPKYNLLNGLKDSYENDFLEKKAAGNLKTDFTCDDIVINDDRIKVKMFDGIPADKI